MSDCSDCPAPRSRRLGGKGLLGIVVGVAIVMLVASVLGGMPLASASVGPAHGPATYGHASGKSVLGHAGGTSARALPRPAGTIHPLASSGRGVFFNSTGLPYATFPGCVYSFACTNTTYDPSMVYTSTGVLAVASTIYTNQSACGNVTHYAVTEIAVTTSDSAAVNWTSPVVLSNTNCGWANQYVDAMQPTLAALPNGTLVLAYIVYNVSIYRNVLYTEWGMQCSFCYDVAFAGLAFTESYNGGVTWTATRILNASSNPSLDTSNWLPERPFLATAGNTVYLAWMNYTQAPGWFASTGSSQIHLKVSFNGGATFGATKNLPNEVAVASENLGINPSLLVAPNGTLYITYDTNFTFYFTWPSGCSTSCSYDIQTVNVVLGTSANNGTSFSFVNISTGVPTIHAYSIGFYRLMGEMYDPSPQLAWNPVDSNLYAIWSQFQPKYVCAPYCGTYYGQNPYISTSSNGGSTWTAAHAVTNDLSGNYGTIVFNPTLLVDAVGTLHVAMLWMNTTLNYREYPMYVNSTNDGASFTAPVYIGNNTTGYPYSPTGEYSSSVEANGNLLFAYALVNGTSTYPSFPFGTGTTRVTVSQFYKGTGVKLTFVESGIQTGTRWGISIFGNLRDGAAPTNLSISGVPPNVEIAWQVTSVAGGYGVRYSAVGSLTSPQMFTASSTIYENYSEQVLLNITSVPNYCTYSFSVYCYPSWNYYYEMALNYNITPGTGAQWVSPGTSYTVSVSPAYYGDIYCSTCTFTYTELTFLSWTGTGSGAVNTTGYNVTNTIQGPVNETANFQLDGSCTYHNPPPPTCTPFNQSLFFHESGLPAGVPWNVTIQSGTTGTVVTGNSTTPWMEITSNATLGVVNYTAWTIPSGTPGLYWVGTGAPGSPVSLPADRVVTITYSLVNITGMNFGVLFNETGLPNLTAWSVNVGSSAYGIQTPSANLLVAGGATTIGAPDVFMNNGTSYYAKSIVVQPYTLNRTTLTFGSLPAALTLEGGAAVTVNFAPEYWTEISASTGGSVGPASLWVHSGGAVTLTATSDPGYYFVGWSGSGPGSVTSTQTGPTVHPSGPVTELATFNVLPASRWTVTVNLAGVPTGANVSFTLGNQSYSTGNLGTVTNLLTGDYNVSVPYSYMNSSDLTRFVPSSWTWTGTTNSPTQIHIDTNGTLTLNYVTQYQAFLTSTSGGTISPAPGVYWWNAGSTYPVTATPTPGYRFVGWSGSMSSTSPTLSIVPTAPVNLTAEFVVRPPSTPAVFTLTVSESGLKAGTLWSVSVGTTGASGTTTSLVIPALNGTYTVNVSNAYVNGYDRFVLTGTPPGQQTVQSNSSLAVSFGEEFLVTVSGGAGGSFGPSSGWVPSGSSVALTATANSGYQFAGWVGTGAGSYSGSSPTQSVTVNNGINETANFTPIYPQQTTGSSTDGLPLAIGLLIGLLVVGLVVGMLLGRRRPPAPESAPAPAEPAPAEGSESTPYGEGGGDT